MARQYPGEQLLRRHGLHALSLQQSHDPLDDQWIAVAVDGESARAFAADSDLVDDLAVIDNAAEQNPAGRQFEGLVALAPEDLRQDRLRRVAEELNRGNGPHPRPVITAAKTAMVQPQISSSLFSSTYFM